MDRTERGSTAGGSKAAQNRADARTRIDDFVSKKQATSAAGRAARRERVDAWLHGWLRAWAEPRPGWLAGAVASARPVSKPAYAWVCVLFVSMFILCVWAARMCTCLLIFSSDVA